MPTYNCTPIRRSLTLSSTQNSFTTVKSHDPCSLTIVPDSRVMAPAPTGAAFTTLRSPLKIIGPFLPCPLYIGDQPRI